MPQEPALGAKRGSAFHQWVEAQFAGQLTIADVFAERDDDESSLAELQEAFNRSEWARRTPVAIELPFVIGIDGHVVRGRIDAVYREGEDLVVVDWKTNSRGAANPQQLLIYRHAAARHFDVPEERVRACFFYVAQGRTEWLAEDAQLPGLR